MLRGKSDVALVFNRPVGGNRGERFSRVLGYRRRDEQPKARPLSRAQERGISHAYTCGVRHHLGRSHWPSCFWHHQAAVVTQPLPPPLKPLKLGTE